MIDLYISDSPSSHVYMYNSMLWKILRLLVFDDRSAFRGPSEGFPLNEVAMFWCVLWGPDDKQEPVDNSAMLDMNVTRPKLLSNSLLRALVV